MDATFVRTRRFIRVVESLGAVGQVQVTIAFNKLASTWRSIPSINELPAGFKFKSLHHEPGSYRVCQIYAGHDHRVALLFPETGNNVYAIHAWKKTRQNDRAEVETAKRRAAEQWVAIVEGRV